MIASVKCLCMRRGDDDGQVGRSLMETANLLRSPANAERLLRSIADAEAGRTKVQDSIDRQHDDPARCPY
jgi:hypothetical protein